MAIRDADSLQEPIIDTPKITFINKCLGIVALMILGARVLRHHRGGRAA